MWAIRDSRTGQRSGVSTYFEWRQAAVQIYLWIARWRQGGRPDISLDYLVHLEPYELRMRDEAP